MRRQLTIFACLVFGAPLASAASQGTTCEDGLKAFQTTLFPLVRAHCASCHGDEGSYYRFAVSDAALARERLLPLQNFQAIAASYFVGRGATMVPAEVSAQALTDAVSGWWQQGEQSCRSGPAFQSLSLTLPEPLPAPGEAAMTLTWSLEHLGTGFEGVSFLMDAQQYTTPSAGVPGSYLLLRPRLASKARPFHVTGVEVAVNGTFFRSGQVFSTVDALVGGDYASPPVLSGSALVILEGNRIHDEIAIGLTTIQPANSTPCQAQTAFHAAVLPDLEARACHFCHAGGASAFPGTPEAKLALDMSVEEAALCTAMRQRLNQAHPEHSPLMTLPDFGAGGHPRASVVAGELTRRWLVWARSEVASEAN